MSTTSVLLHILYTFTQMGNTESRFEHWEKIKHAHHHLMLLLHILLRYSVRICGTMQMFHKPLTELKMKIIGFPNVYKSFLLSPGHLIWLTPVSKMIAEGIMKTKKQLKKPNEQKLTMWRIFFSLRIHKSISSASSAQRYQRRMW